MRPKHFSEFLLQERSKPIFISLGCISTDTRDELYDQTNYMTIRFFYFIYAHLIRRYAHTMDNAKTYSSPCVFVLQHFTF